MDRRTLTGLAALVLVAVLAPSLAFAQDQGGGGQPGGGNRGGGRGNFDPAQMRERYYNMIKEQLGASDDEWKVLLPKVEKVSNARRAGSGFGRGGFGRGGPGGDRQPDANASASEKASYELRKTLENKSASPEEISQKLATLRKAREDAKAELVAAQKELKELLTQRQEAVMVTMGMLE